MTETSPSSTTPAEWLAFASAPEWVARYYDLNEDQARALLASACQSYELPHRVAGWNATSQQWDFRRPPFPAGWAERRMPVGMEETVEGNVRVWDWQLRKSDWNTGTVLNLGEHRSSIELRWSDVVNWLQGRNIPLKGRRSAPTFIKPPAREDIVKLLKEIFAREPKTKRPDAIKECISKLKATHTEVGAALAEVKNRPRRGRPRGILNSTQP